MQKLFGYIKTHFANPGTGNFAFRQNTTLPAFDPNGRGRMVRGNMFVMQNPQDMARPTIPVSGMGGLYAGQLVQQALLTGNENG